MVIKNLENKIKLVLIICSLFLTGCVIISISSIWTARTMVNDAHQKVYVLDGNVPILVNRSTMEETLDVESCPVQHPKGKRLLFEHHGNKCRVQYLL